MPQAEVTVAHKGAGLKVLPLLPIVLVPLLWLAPALRPGYVLSSADSLLGSYLLRSAAPAHHVAANPLIGDTVMQMMPWHREVASDLRAGRMPFWNPHAFAGSPLMGNAQSGVLDPLSFPYLLTRDPVRANVWVMLLRLWVAGLGAWLLALRLGAGKAAAALSGVVYQVGGFTLVWLQCSVVASSVWFPWVFLAAEGVAAVGGARRILLLAGSLTLMTFGGHMEATAFGALGAAVYVALRRGQLRGWSLGTLARSSGAVLGCALLTAALTAPQTLPFLEAVAQGSVLAGRHGSEVTPLRLETPVVMVFPFLFGRPLAGEANLAGDNVNFCEESGEYASVLGLALAFLGLLGADRRSPWRVLAAIGLAALLATAGVPPLIRLVRLAPIVGAAALQRSAFIALLCLALLAGRGLDVLASGQVPRAARILGWILAGTGAGAVVHGAWLLAGAPGYLSLFRLAGRLPFVVSWFTGKIDVLVNEFPRLAPALASHYVLPWGGVVLAGAAVVQAAARRWRPWLAAVVLGVVTADLALFGWGFNPAIPVALAYPRTERLARLAETAGDGRVMVLDWGLLANVASWYGLDDINGYDVIGRRRLTALMRLACSFRPGPPHWPIAWFDCAASPVVDLLDVRAVASARPLQLAGLELVSAARGGGYIYRNTRAMPRAWVPVRAIRVADLDESVRVASGMAGATGTALVEAPAGTPLPASPGTASWRRQSAGAIEIDASMGGPGLVVVSESYDPGWRATVDGARVPVHPCDIALMAVPVPGGVHRVELVFRPRTWTLALLLSAAGLAAMIVLAVAGGPQRRSRRDLRAPKHPAP